MSVMVDRWSRQLRPGLNLFCSSHNRLLPSLVICKTIIYNRAVYFIHMRTKHTFSIVQWHSWHITWVSGLRCPEAMLQDPCCYQNIDYVVRRASRWHYHCTVFRLEHCHHAALYISWPCLGQTNVHFGNRSINMSIVNQECVSTGSCYSTVRS